MTKHSHFPYTSTYISTIQTDNTTSITSLTQTYNILQHSEATNISSRPLHNKYSNIPPTDTTTDIKTNIRHIHTSIVSRHRATRGKNILLRTLPPQNSNSEKYCAHFHHTIAAPKIYLPASRVTPFPNSEQINHPSSNHTYTKLTPNHFHHHCVPSVTPTYTTRIIFSTSPTYAPRCHPWICGQTLLE